MRIKQCRRLQSLLERYVAQEASPAERLIVHQHIQSCDRCRSGVRTQETVRQLLRSRAAEARAQGLAPTWLPRPSQPKRGRTVAIFGLILVPTAVILLFAVMRGRSVSDARSVSAVGVISDSKCGTSHHTDDAYTCIQDCISKGAKYIFISRGVVYPIGNQNFRGLVQFVAREVKLTGHIQEDGLIVSRLDPVN